MNKIVIDEEFAQRYWPNEDAVGKRVKLGLIPTIPVLEVIGVVGRVKMESLNQNSDRVQGYFAFNHAAGRHDRHHQRRVGSEPVDLFSAQCGEGNRSGPTDLQPAYDG